MADGEAEEEEEVRDWLFITSLIIYHDRRILI